MNDCWSVQWGTWLTGRNYTNTREAPALRLQTNKPNKQTLYSYVIWMITGFVYWNRKYVIPVKYSTSCYHGAFIWIVAALIVLHVTSRWQCYIRPGGPLAACVAELCSHFRSNMSSFVSPFLFPLKLHLCVVVFPQTGGILSPQTKAHHGSLCWFRCFLLYTGKIAFRPTVNYLRH